MLYTIQSSSYASTKGFNKSNCLDVLRLLVRYGADVNKPYTYSLGSSYFNNGYPLENAIKEKHSIAVIQFLLDSGANPDYASTSGAIFTPVARAYSNRDMPVVNLLLDRGANGANLLPSAGSGGDNEMIRLLISRGVQIRSDQGAEALRWAALSEKLDTIKLLVENGVNVNARSNDNNETIQEFIPLGATAASIAYDKGEMEIYDYLKANGARDFEPRQVAQHAAPAPSSTTNVYVQQPAPTQAQPAAPQTRIYTITVYYQTKDGRQFTTLETVSASSASEAERLAQEQWLRGFSGRPSTGNTFIRATAPPGAR
jgi:ankyrin repeat protein